MIKLIKGKKREKVKSRSREREESEVMFAKSEKDNLGFFLFSIKLKDLLNNVLKINETIDENLLLNQMQLNIMVNVIRYNDEFRISNSNDSLFLIKNNQSSLKSKFNFNLELFYKTKINLRFSTT